MSIRKLMKLGVVAAVSAAMFGCGGGGGGGGEVPPAGGQQQIEVKGAGVDDYILNGIVQAWTLNGTEVDLKGADNGTCKTGEYGIFNCIATGIDNSTPLLFAIKGGKLDPDGLSNTTDNQKDYKGALLAFAIPKEPVIVSPVTTKVVSKVLDIEPVITEDETHIPESALVGIKDKIKEVAKTVNGTELVKKQSVVLPAIVEKPENFDKMVQVVGNTLNKLREKGELDNLVDSIVVKTENGSVVHAVTNATILQEVVQIVVKEAVEAGNDTEITQAVVQSAIPSANETTVKDIIQAVSGNNTESVQNIIEQHISSQPAVTYERLLVTPTEVCGGGSCSDVQYGFAQPITVSSDEKLVKVSYKTTYLTCTFENGKETCEPPEKDKPFKGVILAIKIKEANGAYADVTLDGVNVTVNPDGKLDIEVTENATLKISGKKSNGEPIEVTLKNVEPDTITVDNNTIKYDLSKVEAKLEALGEGYEVTDTSLVIDKVSVQKAGTYNVSISVIGAPIMPVEGKVIVTQNQPPTIKFSWPDLSTYPPSTKEADDIAVTLEGTESTKVNLILDDPEGDPLTVNATSEDETIASVSYDSDNHILTIQGVKAGETQVDVTVTDGKNIVKKTIPVKVEDKPATPGNEISPVD